MHPTRLVRLAFLCALAFVAAPAASLQAAEEESVYNEIKAREDSLESLISGLEKTIAQGRAELDRLNAQQTKVQEDIEDGRRRLAQFGLQDSDLQDRIKLANRISALEQEIGRERASRDALEGMLKSKDNEAQRMAEEMQRVALRTQEQLSAQAEDMKALQARLDQTEQISQALDGKERLVNDLKAANDDLNRKIGALQAEAAQVRQRAAAASQDDMNRLRSQLAQADQAIQGLKGSAAESEGKLAESQKSVAFLKSELANNQKLLADNEAARRQLAADTESVRKQKEAVEQQAKAKVDEQAALQKKADEAMKQKADAENGAAAQAAGLQKRITDLDAAQKQWAADQAVLRQQKEALELQVRTRLDEQTALQKKLDEALKQKADAEKNAASQVASLQQNVADLQRQVRDVNVTRDQGLIEKNVQVAELQKSLSESVQQKNALEASKQSRLGELQTSIHRLEATIQEISVGRDAARKDAEALQKLVGAEQNKSSQAQQALTAAQKEMASLRAQVDERSKSRGEMDAQLAKLIEGQKAGDAALKAANDALQQKTKRVEDLEKAAREGASDKIKVSDALASRDVALKQLEQLRAEFAKTQADKSALEKQAGETASRLASTESEFFKARQALAAAATQQKDSEKRIHDLDQQVAATTEVLQGRLKEVSRLSEVAAKSEKSLADMKATIEPGAKARAELQQLADARAAALSEKDKQLAALKDAALKDAAALADLKAKLDAESKARGELQQAAAGHAADLAAKDKALQESAQARSKLETDYTAVQDAMKRSQFALAKLSDGLRSDQEQSRSLQDQRDALGRQAALLATNLDKEKAARVGLEKESANRGRALNELQAKFNQATQDAQALRTRGADLEKRAAKAEGQLKPVSDELARTVSALQQMTANNDKTAADNASLKKSLENSQRQTEEVRKVVAERDAALGEREKLAAGLQAQIAELTAERDGAQTAVAALKTAVTDEKKRGEKNAAQVGELRADATALRKQAEENAAAHAALAGKFDESEKALKSNQFAMMTLTDNLEKKNIAFEELSQQSTATAHELASVSADLAKEREARRAADGATQTARDELGVARTNLDGLAAQLATAKSESDGVIASLRDELERSRAAVGELTGLRNAADQKAITLQTELEHSKAELAALHQSHAEQARAIEETSTALDGARQESARAVEQENSSQQQLGLLRQTVESLDAKVRDGQAEAQSLKAALAAAEQTAADLKAKAAGDAVKMAELEKRKSDLAAAGQETARLRKELAEQQEAMKGSQAALSKLGNDIRKQQKVDDELQAIRADLDKQLTQTKAILQSESDTRQRMEKQWKESSARASALDEQLAIARAQAAAASTDAAQAHESVQSLMKSNSELQGQTDGHLTAIAGLKRELKDVEARLATSEKRSEEAARELTRKTKALQDYDDTLKAANKNLQDIEKAVSPPPAMTP